MRCVTLFTLILACVLVGCGSERAPAPTPVQTPRPPFGLPNPGTPIEILAPQLDTDQSSNLLATTKLPAGPVELTWTPVAEAHGYLVIVADVTGVMEHGDDLKTAVSQWSEAPRATVDLGAPDRSVVFQIFAYRGVDVLGQSDVWAVTTTE